MNDHRSNTNIEEVYLYGEGEDWPMQDLIHCELLFTRSELHDWVIKPHRHKNLLQIFHLQEGSATAHLDSEDLQFGSASLLVVPEMSVHDFIWAPESKGHVLFIAKPLLARIDNFLGTQDWGSKTPALFELGDDQQFLDQLFSQILIEYQGNSARRELMIENMCRALAIWISRQSIQSKGSEPPQDRAAHNFSRFTQLLEENFKEQRHVSWYAQEIGVTPSHLNAICKKIAGQSAQETCHARLLLEAKRNLLYTPKSVAEISDQLSFSEASYFNRFFKRNTGLTPRQFRNQQFS